MTRPLPYKINPAKATCMRCDSDGGCGIHSYNDTCFNICAAYSGTTDPYAVDSDCAQSCTEMIEEKRHQFYGVGYCDHQQPYRPVIWENAPPYFVNLLQQGMDPKQALEKSKKLCEERSPSIASECMERQVDYYNAIESYKSDTKPALKHGAKLQRLPKISQQKRKNNYGKVAAIIVSVLLFAVLLSIIASKA